MSNEVTPPVGYVGQMPVKTPWMNEIKKYLGMSEEKNNAVLAQFWKYAGEPTWNSVQGAVHAWCAMMVNGMLHATGFSGTGKPNALSFATYGTPCTLQAGCIVVFKWASGDHHVTFCDHIVDENLVACLGGNQNDHVKVSEYERKFIIATRWPVKTS